MVGISHQNLMAKMTPKISRHENLEAEGGTLNPPPHPNDGHSTISSVTIGPTSSLTSPPGYPTKSPPVAEEYPILPSSALQSSFSFPSVLLFLFLQ